MEHDFSQEPTENSVVIFQQTSLQLMDISKIYDAMMQNEKTCTFLSLNYSEMIKLPFSVKYREIDGSSMLLKVTDFGTGESPVCELLVTTTSEWILTYFLFRTVSELYTSRGVLVKLRYSLYLTPSFEVNPPTLDCGS